MVLVSLSSVLDARTTRVEMLPSFHSLNIRSSTLSRENYWFGQNNWTNMDLEVTHPSYQQKAQERN